jgi:hypothetical protein
VPPKELSHISQAEKIFRQTLHSDQLEKIARSTNFVQRKRSVTGSGVFWALIVSLGAHSMQYISDVLRTYNSRENSKIQYKPFWNRLAKRAFALFMKKIFELLCRELAYLVLRAEIDSDTSLFSDILIDDGSSFAVADGLREIFPGRFKKVKPAAIELHAHMSLFKDQIISVTLAADKESEHHYIPHAKSLPKGSLSIRDRGYIDINYFQQLTDAYLICRARSDINPIVERIEGVSSKIAEKWEGKHFKEIPKEVLKKGADLVVCWQRGNEEVKLRLIVRHRQPNLRRKKRNRKITVKERKRAMKDAWMLLVNNLPKQISSEAIVKLYRIRWQIELTFKEWKSYANLHALQSENQYIVEGFIWASLCAALLKRTLAHWAQTIYKRPISTRIAAQSGPMIIIKLADWLQKYSLAIDTYFKDILEFLANNSRRTHPKRDKSAPVFTLGLRRIGLNVPA